MIETIVTIGVIALAVIAIAVAVWVFVLRKRPKAALNQDYFHRKWQELQKLLKDKTKWSDAILQADDLLAEALKKKRITGKGIGERLVKVQRMLTDNDGVWFGHKLRSKLDHEPEYKVKEKEVKQALVGIRQALKDLGALPNAKSRDKK